MAITLSNPASDEGYSCEGSILLSMVVLTHVLTRQSPDETPQWVPAT
ncbi:MAG: hypothetical protein WBB01_22705 [Phormidesmis sp.]